MSSYVVSDATAACAAMGVLSKVPAERLKEAGLPADPKGLARELLRWNARRTALRYRERPAHVQAPSERACAVAAGLPDAAWLGCLQCLRYQCAEGPDCREEPLWGVASEAMASIVGSHLADGSWALSGTGGHRDDFSESPFGGRKALWSWLSDEGGRNVVTADGEPVLVPWGL